MFKELIKTTKEITKDTVLVIMSTFNREKSIIKAAESILQQTHSNTILHIIDDNSTDNTINILVNHFKNKNYDNVILTISDKNQGTYENRNYSLDYHKDTKFGYWTIQDSDDISSDNRLEILIDKIGNYMAIQHHYERKNNGVNPAVGLILYKKESFTLLGYYDDTRFSGDYDYYMRLKYKNNKIIYIKNNLYWADWDESCLTKKIPGNKRAGYHQKIEIEHRKGILFRDYKK